MRDCSTPFSFVSVESNSPLWESEERTASPPRLSVVTSHDVFCHGRITFCRAEIHVAYPPILLAARFPFSLGWTFPASLTAGVEARRRSNFENFQLHAAARTRAPHAHLSGTHTHALAHKRARTQTRTHTYSRTRADAWTQSRTDAPLRRRARARASRNVSLSARNYGSYPTLSKIGRKLIMCGRQGT